MNEYEMFTRKNRFNKEKKSAGTVMAPTKMDAINEFCIGNNNVWVSAKKKE